MTKEELLSYPTRRWDEIINDAIGVYVIPSERLHDSGFLCMDFVAEKLVNGKEIQYIRFGGFCDDVRLDGDHFRVDCTKEGIIHIWNRKKFSIFHDLSSIDFLEKDENIRR